MQDLGLDLHIEEVDQSSRSSSFGRCSHVSGPFKLSKGNISEVVREWDSGLGDDE